MLEDVAVIEVFSGVAFEADDDTGDHACRTFHNILPSGFIWLRQYGGANIANPLVILIVEDVEDTTIEYLEADQMEVHGMKIFGEVDELPDLGGVELGGFGNGLVPSLAVEQHEHGVTDLIEILVESDGAGGDSGGLRDTVDGAECGGYGRSI